jgi:hypothetical protein
MGCIDVTCTYNKARATGDEDMLFLNRIHGHFEERMRSESEQDLPQTSGFL